MTRIKRIFTD